MGRGVRSGIGEFINIRTTQLFLPFLSSTRSQILKYTKFDRLMLKFLASLCLDNPSSMYRVLNSFHGFNTTVLMNTILQTMYMSIYLSHNEDLIHCNILLYCYWLLFLLLINIYWNLLSTWHCLMHAYNIAARIIKIILLLF